MISAYKNKLHSVAFVKPIQLVVFICFCLLILVSYVFFLKRSKTVVMPHVLEPTIKKTWTKKYTQNNVSISIPQTWKASNSYKGSLIFSNMNFGKDVVFFEDTKTGETVFAIAKVMREDSSVKVQSFFTLPRLSFSVQAQERAISISLKDIPTGDVIPYARYTSDPNPTIYVRNAGSEYIRYKISEDPQFSSTAWKNYSGNERFAFSNGDGEKKVYVRFEKQDGTTVDISETFYLDTLPPVGGIALDQPIIGPSYSESTIYLGVEDNLSGVSAMRIDTSKDFKNAVWQPYASNNRFVFTNSERTRSGLVYVQFRDNVGNMSEIYEAPYLYDTTPPIVYVEVEGENERLERTVRIYSYDELTNPQRMKVTNDPLFSSDSVVIMNFQDSIFWKFDERRVIWVQVQDAVGNWSEPYPAYANGTPTSSPQASNSAKTSLVPTTLLSPAPTKTPSEKISELKASVQRMQELATTMQTVASQAVKLRARDIPEHMAVQAQYQLVIDDKTYPFIVYFFKGNESSYIILSTESKEKIQEYMQTFELL